MPSSKLHIITAVAVIQRGDGKILLLKRSSKEKVYPGAFTFPGGKVEGNDTLTETLQKEVLEESGLRLEPGILLIKEKSIGRPDGGTSKSLSFLCTAVDTTNVVIEEPDFTEYRWVDLNELKNLDHVGIVAEFEKVEAIVDSGINRDIFMTDTDKADFRT